MFKTPVYKTLILKNDSDLFDTWISRLFKNATEYVDATTGHQLWLDFFS